jgi:predicted nucleotidyltransferase
MIPQEKINEVVERIVKNVQPEKVILFGSYAYGEPDEDSDLDILVIKESVLPRHERVKEIKKYLQGIKIPVDLIVYTTKEIDEWRGVLHN